MADRRDLAPVLATDAARRETLDAMLRVDHAGETAAVRIYEGQLAVLGGTAERDVLEEMAAHERAHLRRFDELLPAYRARPTALLPVWEAAGFALGAAGALLGRESAHAVTKAVEEVITEHYNDQLRELRERGYADEELLRRTFRQFRDEEQEHLDVAHERGADAAPMAQPISAVVKAGCKAAIWLSKRV